MGSIAIVGIDADPNSAAFADVAERLMAAKRVVISSREGVTATALALANIEATTLSDLGLSPQASVDSIIEHLLDLASDADIVYVTAGYPFLHEGLVSGLLVQSSEDIDVLLPGLSPLHLILLAFDIDLTADLDIVDVRSLAPDIAQRTSHLIIMGVRNKLLLHRAAERLSEIYPSNHQVIVATARGTSGLTLSLYPIDCLEAAEVAEDSALYVGPSRITVPGGFDELVRLIAMLRGPDGCPWDRAQSHLSLRRHMLEEAYEAVAAIETGDAAELADELGDVLLQVVLHAQIGADDGRFTIEEVLSRINEKIRRRHPHVFGNAEASTPSEVAATWDAIKRDENTGRTAGVLDGVPDAFPALMRAQKISRRVVGVGFEWETLDDVWDKIHEEIAELKATEPGSPQAAGEIGDLLFTVVNLARKQGIDAEEALRGTCEKFISRWEDMESSARKKGLDIKEIPTDGLEGLWQDAKKKET